MSTLAEQMLEMLSTETLRRMAEQERQRLEPDWETINDFEAEIKRRNPALAKKAAEVAS
jgi:hypothetical protein